MEKTINVTIKDTFKGSGSFREIAEGDITSGGENAGIVTVYQTDDGDMMIMMPGGKKVYVSVRDIVAAVVSQVD